MSTIDEFVRIGRAVADEPDPAQELNVAQAAARALDVVGAKVAWYRSSGGGNSDHVLVRWYRASERELIELEPHELLFTDDIERSLRALHPCEVPGCSFVRHNAVYDVPVVVAEASREASFETILAVARRDGRAYSYLHCVDRITVFARSKGFMVTCEGDLTVVTFDPAGVKRELKKQARRRSKRAMLSDEIVDAANELSEVLGAQIARGLRESKWDSNTKAERIDRLVFVINLINVAYRKNAHRRCAAFIKFARAWRERFDACQVLGEVRPGFVAFMNLECRLFGLRWGPRRAARPI